MTLLDRQLLFVTGKGGVGKTTIAVGLAALAASEGRRTLVCEMDAKGAVGAAFGLEHLGYEPQQVSDRLWAMSMDTEQSLREYLRVVARIPLVGRLGPLARTFDFVADAAPGVKEILSIGKVAFDVRERRYDLVVVDAEASGHVVAQLDAPKVIRDMVRVGAIRDQTQWMLDILSDPKRTGVVAVSTPEEIPVTETIELLDRVRTSTSVDVAAVVANRVPSPWFAPSDAAVLDQMRSPAAQARIAAAAGIADVANAAAVFDAAATVTARRAAAMRHLDQLRAGVGVSMPLVLVPDLPRADVSTVRAALEGELQ